MRKGALSSINQLHDWFMANKRPYWTLYRGFMAAKRLPSSRLISNTDDSDLDEAWEGLEDMIRKHSSGGGDFTIAVADNPNLNNPYQTFLALGNDRYSGVSGYGQGSPGFYSEHDVQRRIDDAIERERLRRDVEDLQDQLEAGASEGMIGKLASAVGTNPALQNIAVQLLSKVVGLLENPNKQQSESIGSRQATPGASSHQSLEKLQRVFGNADEVLNTIAEFAESNPEAAIAFFNQLKSQVHE